MPNPPIKPFEELAREWAPRAKRFLALLADQLSSRVKKRLPGLITGSAFLFAAVFSAVGVVAWLSIAAWFSLRNADFSPAGASLVVVGVLAVFSLLFSAAARRRARRPSGPPVELLEPENPAIEEAGRDLITLFKDLTIAAKRSLSPNEVLKPHAVKIAVATTALGFLLAVNLNARKEKAR